MQFEIHTKNIKISQPLRVHIERRLSFALERFAVRIARVCVRVGDQNGPKGGVDKRCRVAIVLLPSTTIVMEDQDANIYTAIDRVADKAGRCIGRSLKRRTSGRRHMRISELLG
jgi:putative sigma-54 modulation protein